MRGTTRRESPQSRGSGLVMVMRGVVLALVVLLLTAAGTGAQSSIFAEGAAAGDVRADSAVIWTRTRGPAEVRVEFSTAPDFRNVQTSDSTTTGPEGDYTAHVGLRDLPPGQRIYYRVAATSETGPGGSFITAPAPTRDAPLALIWGADTQEELRPFRIFQAMQRRAPDVFLYLGDTIYSDLGSVRATTLDAYRQKYRANREDPHLRAFLSSTSSWVMWDDHEVANNFDSRHARLAVGLRAFLDSWPIRTPPGQPTRLYRSLRWGRGAEIFILDTRQYRSPSRAPDGAGKTMLGREQKQWLIDGLRRSDAAVKIVASSVVLRHHGADSWEGYPTERDEILQAVRDLRVANVFVLSADVHYAAWIRHPEGIFEAVSGPLAASRATTARSSGRPGVLWTAAGRFNYGWMRIAPDAVTLEWRDDGDALLHQVRVTITR